MLVDPHTRQLGIAVVRRLLEMGPKKGRATHKKLCDALAREARKFCADASKLRCLFPVFLILLRKTLARAVRKMFHNGIAFDNKKWPMLKNSATLIQFPTRREVADAYLQRRQ
jgi:hypothetical protein